MVLIFRRLSGALTPHSRSFTIMSNLPPSVWQFAGILLVFCMISGIERMWKNFKKMKSEYERLLLEIARLEKKAGLPLLLTEASFENGVTYEIKLVTYTGSLHVCFIYVEIEPQKPWKVFSLMTESQIKSSDPFSLKAGNHFVLWVGPYAPSSKRTIKSFRRIEIVPNPHTAETPA